MVADQASSEPSGQPAGLAASRVRLPASRVGRVRVGEPKTIALGRLSGRLVGVSTWVRSKRIRSPGRSGQWLPCSGSRRVPPAGRSPAGRSGRCRESRTAPALPPRAGPTPARSASHRDPPTCTAPAPTPDRRTSWPGAAAPRRRCSDPATGGRALPALGRGDDRGGQPAGHDRVRGHPVGVAGGERVDRGARRPDHVEGAPRKPLGCGAGHSLRGRPGSRTGAVLAQRRAR